MYFYVPKLVKQHSGQCLCLGMVHGPAVLQFTNLGMCGALLSKFETYKMCSLKFLNLGGIS